MKSSSLVFTIAIGGYETLFESCIQTHIDYCNKNNFKHILVNTSPRTLKPAEAAWLKIPLIKCALEAGYEWVSFIDADCDVRINTPHFSSHFNLLDQNKTIFMAPGYSGRINSGVIFAKRSALSIDFFATVISNADIKVPQEDKAPYENGHVIHFGKNNPTIYLLEHNLWNNNSQLDDESYIQHYSGGPLRKWYMRNRAPAEWKTGSNQSGSNLRSLLSKVKNKLGFDTASTCKNIDQLMRFYKAKYPEFVTLD